MRRAPARDSRRVYKIHYSQTHTCTCYFGKMRRRRTLDVVRRRPTPSCRKRSRPTNVERIASHRPELRLRSLRTKKESCPRTKVPTFQFTCEAKPFI